MSAGLALRHANPGASTITRDVALGWVARGEPGSVAQALGVAFNASPVTAHPTEAQLYRGAERSAGVQLFDEVETLLGDGKRFDALITVLNVGFERGGVVGIAGDHGGRRVTRAQDRDATRFELRRQRRQRRPSSSAPHRPAPAHLDSIFTVKLLAVYTRRLTAPDRSFFLFGPRGTGKTTWLRRTFPDALWFDLVRDAEVVRLIRDPDVFRSEVEARSGSWVVVDEVQRHPPILNEVQDLIARHGRRYRYALTGSSARRLRREQANLLAARVVNRRFFPLTAAELGRDFDLEAALRWGTLPSVTSEPDERGKIDLLDAYVSNYIGQEIRLEAAVRRLDAFTRFLEIAALANGQVTNVSNIARDAAVARPTVQGYFETLVDTLLGTWLPAWRPRARVKEAGHPKFYFFDPGVVRALAGRLREPLERAERGPLLETYILHELRAWQDHAGCGGEFAYWGTPSQAEVDFVWTRARRAVGIEIKAVPRWRTGEARALADLVERGIVGRAYGVYEGRAALRSDAVEVLPVAAFLERLYAGEIIG